MYYWRCTAWSTGDSQEVHNSKGYGPWSSYGGRCFGCCIAFCVGKSMPCGGADHFSSVPASQARMARLCHVATSFAGFTKRLLLSSVSSTPSLGLRLGLRQLTSSVTQQTTRTSAINEVNPERRDVKRKLFALLHLSHQSLWACECGEASSRIGNTCWTKLPLVQSRGDQHSRHHRA